MSTRVLIWGGLALLVLGAAGCAGSRSVVDVRPDLPAAFPHHTLAEIQHWLQPAADTLTAFEAKARLAIYTPEQSGTLSADVQSRRNDSLYLALSPALGLVVARVLVTPDSFFVYDRIKKRLDYGSLAYATAFLPGPLSGDDVFRNMLGLTQPEADVAWTVAADSAFYYLRDPDGRRRYTIDPTIWRVVRYEERTAEGVLVEERQYEAYDRFGRVFLPRRILFNRPLDDTRISIYYNDLTLNPHPLAFTWRVSDSAERVLAGEPHGLTND